ncbi:MAG: hypothetical protein ACRCSK_04450 [Fusobacteriaceae bacterium]
MELKEIMYELLSEIGEEKKDLFSDIDKISGLLKIDPGKIIENAIITDVSKNTKPNYENYKFIYMTGRQVALSIKGRKPRVTGSHGIPSNLDVIVKSFDTNEINNNILQTAFLLTDATLDRAIKSGGKKEEIYKKIIDDIMILRTHIELSTKILGEHLINQNITLANQTLEYMCKMIREDKRNITKKFVHAFSSGDQNSIIEARKYYHETINGYFDDFLEKQNFSYHTAKKIGEESMIVKMLGQDNIDYLFGIILYKFRLQLMERYGISEESI